MSPICSAPRAQLIIFLLDVSDSMSEALEDLKEWLRGSLGSAYFRRDPVAVIVVQGADPRVLVHPTTSPRYTLDRLSSLRVGGGTPLGRALILLRRMLIQWRAHYPTIDLVVLSDGRSTGSLSGGAIESAVTTITKFTRRRIVLNPIPEAEPFANALAKQLKAFGASERLPRPRGAPNHPG